MTFAEHTWFEGFSAKRTLSKSGMEALVPVRVECTPPSRRAPAGARRVEPVVAPALPQKRKAMSLEDEPIVRARAIAGVFANAACFTEDTHRGMVAQLKA